MENERYIAERIQVRYEDEYMYFIYQSIEGERFKSAMLLTGCNNIQDREWEFAEKVFRHLKISLLLKEIYEGIRYYEFNHRERPKDVILNRKDFYLLEERNRTEGSGFYNSPLKMLFGLKIIRTEDIEQGTFKVC